jgi:hypothetical protein
MDFFGTHLKGIKLVCLTLEKRAGKRRYWSKSRNQTYCHSVTNKSV